MDTRDIEGVHAYAKALPEVTQQPHHQMDSYRVAGKIFATVPPGGTHLHLFVDELTRERACAMSPQAVEKLFWGAKVAGLRVQLAEATREVVEDLLLRAWYHKAPKHLASQQGLARTQ